MLKFGKAKWAVQTKSFMLTPPLPGSTPPPREGAINADYTPSYAAAIGASKGERLVVLGDTKPDGPWCKVRITRGATAAEGFVPLSFIALDPPPPPPMLSGTLQVSAAELLFCTQKTKGSHQQQLRSTTPLLSALCDIDVAASVPEQARAALVKDDATAVMLRVRCDGRADLRLFVPADAAEATLAHVAAVKGQRKENEKTKLAKINRLKSAVKNFGVKEERRDDVLVPATAAADNVAVGDRVKSMGGDRGEVLTVTFMEDRDATMCKVKLDSGRVRTYFAQDLLLCEASSPTDAVQGPPAMEISSSAAIRARPDSVGSIVSDFGPEPVRIKSLSQSAKTKDISLLLEDGSITLDELALRFSTSDGWTEATMLLNDIKRVVCEPKDALQLVPMRTQAAGEHSDPVEHRPVVIQSADTSLQVWLTTERAQVLTSAINGALSQFASQAKLRASLRATRSLSTSSPPEPAEVVAAEPELEGVTDAEAGRHAAAAAEEAEAPEIGLQ